MGKRGQQTSSTEASLEAEIDEAVEGWIAKGWVIDSEWGGAPLLQTPLPHGPGIYFDHEAAERVVRFFLLLKQLIGKWAGIEFRLLDWQVRYLVAPVFGIKGPNGKRVIRTFWFEIPRKNGKSTLCSGLALYLFMADREPGAQVYAAAAAKEQAGLVFKPSRDMAAGSPAIAAKLGKRGIQRGRLEHPVTGAIFRALASTGDLQQGLNIHGAVVDEVHVHKNPDLIDALETATGSREQPLIGFITTADEGKDGTVYATKREYIDDLVSGSIQDPTWYAVVFGVDHTVENFDPFAHDTIAAANPGAGITVMWDYLEAKAREAKASPAQLNRYLRLHLNIRTKQLTRWLPIDRYDATGQMIDDAEWKSKVVTGGLDLSTSSDFTAFVIRGRDPERGHPVRAMFWLPEERLPVLERLTKMPLKRWVKEGWLRTTEGNVVDYGKVRTDIVAERDRLGIEFASVGYDPWNATETVVMMMDDGFNMVPIRQGYANLSPPTKALERLILGSTAKKPMIRTAGNPILRWMADCVEVRTDDNGNIKPVKPDRNKSAKRIDGISAWVMAEREDMAVEATTVADDYMADLVASQAAASK